MPLSECGIKPCGAGGVGNEALLARSASAQRAPNGRDATSQNAPDLKRAEQTGGEQGLQAVVTTRTDTAVSPIRARLAQ